jgi:hypothetical protein
LPTDGTCWGPVGVADADVVEDVVGEDDDEDDPDTSIYVSSLLEPPQYSSRLPSHCILQLAVVELVLPFSKTFPQ